MMPTIYQAPLFKSYQTNLSAHFSSNFSFRGNQIQCVCSALNGLWLGDRNGHVWRLFIANCREPNSEEEASKSSSAYCIEKEQCYFFGSTLEISRIIYIEQKSLDIFAHLLFLTYVMYSTF